MKKILFFALMGLVIFGSFTSCKKDKPQPTVADDMFCITALENNVDVSLVIENPSKPSAQVSLLYSLDGQNWSDFIVGQTVVTISNTNDKMFVKANKENTTFSYDISTSEQEDYNGIMFSFSRKAKVSGNILYLLNGENPNSVQMKDYAFAALFMDCDNLVDASALILPEKLSRLCYCNMFLNCTSLKTAPVLPATVLAYGCYNGMFYECSSLQNAPALPAVVMAEKCYSGMFYDCKSLQEAPALPSTSLAYGCYTLMFFGCTALQEVPDLPAEYVPTSAYNAMFGSCTSLVNAPAIAATTVELKACYRMFKDCTSLVNGPTLHATTLAERSYHLMFSGCTSLMNVTCKATDISAEDCLTGWMEGVTTNGVLHAVPGTDWTGKIPVTWTVEYGN